MDVAPRFVHYLASCRIPIGRKKWANNVCFEFWASRNTANSRVVVGCWSALDAAVIEIEENNAGYGAFAIWKVVSCRFLPPSFCPSSLLHFSPILIYLFFYISHLSMSPLVICIVIACDTHSYPFLCITKIPTTDLFTGFDLYGPLHRHKLQASYEAQVLNPCVESGL